MKQSIMDIEERLTLLPISEVEAVSRFTSEYAEYDVFLKSHTVSSPMTFALISLFLQSVISFKLHEKIGGAYGWNT